MKLEEENRSTLASPVCLPDSGHGAKRRECWTTPSKEQETMDVREEII